MRRASEYTARPCWSYSAARPPESPAAMRWSDRWSSACDSAERPGKPTTAANSQITIVQQDLRRARAFGWSGRPEGLQPRMRSYNGRGAGAEVAAQDAGGAGAQPFVEHLGIHRPEVGLVLDVATIVLERRVRGRRVERGRRPVDAAAHAAAHGHHHRSRAVVRAAAAVLADPPAELRELQHERVVQQTLVAQVVVEGQQAVAEGAHQRGVG